MKEANLSKAAIFRITKDLTILIKFLRLVRIKDKIKLVNLSSEGFLKRPLKLIINKFKWSFVFLL